MGYFIFFPFVFKNLSCMKKKKQCKERLSAHRSLLKKALECVHEKTICGLPKA